MSSNDNVEAKESYQANEVIATINDPDSDDGEDNGAWSFESDHAALKNNTDYMNLLRTLTLLQAQRIQTVKDLESLRKIKQKVIEDPATFVERMQNGEDVGFPPPIKVAEVPHVDWTNYKAGPRRYARLHARGAYNDASAATDAGAIKMPGLCRQNTGHVPRDEQGGNHPSVRGWALDDSKPVMFNRLWTAEEQGRLEELLAQFPPEEVEQSRYRKIAEALGNRTAKQVSSRIQKYFVKLQQAGLPIPGRTPRHHAAVRHRSQRNAHAPTRQSTFFPPRTPGDYARPDTVGRLRAEPPAHHRVLVALDRRPRAEGPDGGEEGGNKDSEDSDDDTMNIAGKVERAEAIQHVILLQRVLQARKGEKTPAATHHGFKCDQCQEEPIIGTRWHCTTCVSTSFDFCDDCVVTQAESSSPHPLSHRLEAFSGVVAADSIYDEDYGPRAFPRNSGLYDHFGPDFASPP